jgi:hypothetical protein
MIITLTPKGIFNIYIKQKVMKEFIAKYQKAIVGTGAVSVLLICYFQQKELSKLRAEPKIEVYTGGDIQKGKLIDSLQNRCDSLHDELFISKTQNGRYELTFDHLKEVNPKLGKEMEDWMSHETE